MMMMMIIIIIMIKMLLTYLGTLIADAEVCPSETSFTSLLHVYTSIFPLHLIYQQAETDELLIEMQLTHIIKCGDVAMTHLYKQLRVQFIKKRVFSVGHPQGSASPLQLSDLLTVYTTTNRNSALSPAFYAKALVPGNHSFLTSVVKNINSI